MDGAGMDPFPLVKQQVQSSVRQLEADMATWRDLLKRTNTHTNQSFQRSHRSVRKQLKQLNNHIKALSQTVTAVESQRARFPNIDDEELENRKNFVTETKTIVEGYQKLVNDPATKEKRESDKRKVEALKAEPENDFSPIGDGRFSKRMQDQEELEEKQDDMLEDMQTVLGRLGVAANNIDLELAEHKELLKELDTEIDTAQGRMGTAMKKLQKLLGTSSNSKICCLLIMFLMVIILLAIAVLG